MQHSTLMMAVDFRPRDPWTALFLAAAGLLYALFMVIGMVNWLAEVEAGQRSFWLGLPVALLLIPLGLELILISVLWVVVYRSRRLRSKVFRRMMNLRERHPFLHVFTDKRGERYRLVRRFALIARNRSAFLGMLAMVAPPLLYLTRFIA